MRQGKHEPGAMSGRLLWVFGLAVLFGVSTACQDGAPPSNDAGRIRVVATTTILADVVSAVGGTDVDVQALVPLGVDTHDYQASSQQVAALNQADLVIANGLGLEEGLIDVLRSATQEDVPLLELAHLLDPIALPGAEAESCDPGGDTGAASVEGCDPHVWMDPVRMAGATRLIGESLAAIEPDIDWEERVEGYIRELEQVDAEIELMLTTVEPDSRKLVTNHESLGYFADRYGFEILGAVIPGGTTLGEPSSASLAALVELMKKEEVSVIFAETIDSTALAETVAAELDHEILVVELFTESLGEPGSNAENLTEMLRANAQAIAEALG